jgi:glutaredoxin-related protein
MNPTSLNYATNNEQINNVASNGLGFSMNHVIVTDHATNDNSNSNQIHNESHVSQSPMVLNTDNSKEKEQVIESKIISKDSATRNDKEVKEPLVGSNVFGEDYTAKKANTSKDESRKSLFGSESLPDDNANSTNDGCTNDNIFNDVINDNYSSTRHNSTETSGDESTYIDLTEKNDLEESLDADTDTKLELQKGMSFENWTEFEKYFEKYKFLNFTHTSTGDSKPNKATTNEVNKYRMVQYKCVHYGKPRISQSTNQRPNQSYMGRDCMFEVIVKFDKDINKYHIDRVHAEHQNHEVSKSSYMQHPLARRLKDQELAKYVREYLMELKVSKAKIKDIVEKETGKKITSKDLQNLKEREKRKVNADTIQSVMLLMEKEKEDNPGSTFRVLYRTDSDGADVIKAMYWESKDMKEVFKNNCSVVYMDGTYGLSNCGYTTITFSILDNHKKTNLIAWCFVSNERQETMQEALKLFKEANADIIDQVAYVVVDKDFTELAALAREMPGTEFIICRFHALQAVTKKLQSLKLDKEIAKTFANAFNKMVFSPDEAEYNKNWDTMIHFEPMTPDVKRFIEYIDNNWHAHKDHFAMHLLKCKKLYDSYTNNRTEGQNQKLKQRIKKRSPLDVVVKELLSFSNSQKNNLQGRDWSTNNKSFIPTDIGNDRYKEEIVRVGNDLFLSKRIIEDILKQYKLLHLVNEHELSLDKGQTICSQIKKGPCTFSSSNHLPCKHLLYVRRHNIEVMLDESMFEEKWLKQTDFQKVGKKCTAKVMKEMPTSKLRFYDSNGMVKDLVNHLQSCNDTNRNDKIDELERKIHEWRKESDTSKINPTMEYQQNDSDEKFNLKLSPHKRCHLNNSGMTRNIKKRRVDGPGPSPLEPWMQECNKEFTARFNINGWSRKDFDVLTDQTLMGTNLFLSDNHLDWAMALIKNKFPDIYGLFSPCLYHSWGFPAIEPGNKFIQIIYAGGPHWVTLENCSITTNKRNCELELYDSLSKLQPGSKTLYDINPAIVWQSAQLLRRQDHDEKTPWSIFITVRPCHQQWPNFTDCGLFAIANAFSISLNKRPDDLQYSKNMREELMNKVKSMEATMFSTVKKDSAKFKVESSVGNVLDNVPLKKITIKFDLLCHCQMPLTYGNLVTCDGCNFEFHMKCYMIHDEKTLKDIKDFYCYSCRKPGQYDFLQVANKPDHVAINAFVGRLEKQKTFRFSRYMHETRAFHKKKLVVTKEQLQQLSKIYVKYDLNMVCLKIGPIYTTLFNLHSSLRDNLTRKCKFEKLTRAELINFVVLLICDLENCDCPPLHYAKVASASKSKFENVHDSNKQWIGQLLGLSKDIVKKIDKFCSVENNVTEVIEFVSTINKELKDMDDYGTELFTLYDEAINSSDFPTSLQSEKDIVLNNISTICTMANEYNLKLQQYQDTIFK